MQASKVSKYGGNGSHSTDKSRLKCNRGHPCDNCTKRGDTGSCTYAAPGNRKKSTASTGATTSPDDMQNRIDRLEGLVLALMTNGAQSAGPAAAQAAIAQSLSSGSSDQHFDIPNMGGPMSTSAPESIPEEDVGDESEMENVTKSIGVMKVHNNSTVFASEAHWYAILGEVCSYSAQSECMLITYSFRR